MHTSGRSQTSQSRGGRRLASSHNPVVRAVLSPGRLISSWIDADGARESGLTTLTRTTICNFAADAALAVALAGTLFFSATTGQSKHGVALYLLVTIAPFAVIAPLIGPALDRVHRGRRIALSLTFALRLLLAIWLMVDFGSWVLYPAALGMMVTSKSFGVLKSAMTPRLAPESIDLVRVNARLTIIGHIVGSGVVGAIAAAVSYLAGPKESLWVLVLISLAGIYSCATIPAKAESHDDEWQTSNTLTTLGILDPADDPTTPLPTAQRGASRPSSAGGFMRQTASRAVRTLTVVSFPAGARTCLWAVATSRAGTGFLTIFIAFAAKSTDGLTAVEQLSILAVAGGAGAAGTFGGNLLGERIQLGAPRTTVLVTTLVSWAATLCGAIWPGLIWTSVATFALAFASSLCKVSLDATIQREVPEAARASAFGRSETFGQLAWVFGGTLGIIVPPNLDSGFIWLSIVIGLLLARTAQLAFGLPFSRLLGRS